MYKLLFYCTKGKLSLRKSIKDKDYYLDNGSKFNIISKEDYALNGKIVAECDFEVEEINYRSAKFVCNRYYLEILKRSCLTDKQMYDYLKGKNGYAIHIKNLHIFDKQKELSDYYTFNGIVNNINNWKPIDKAPQNMMYCYDNGEKCILISIRPEWLCKILNGEKTIEVRKKVLKEML